MSSKVLSSSMIVAQAVGRVAHALSFRTDSLVIGKSLRRAGVVHAAPVSTHTKPHELQALFRLASHCPPQALALEIGSYVGASSCYIAAGLARVDGRLLCVDTWQNETMPEGERDTFAEFQQNIAGVRQRIAMIRKRSDALTDGDIPAPLDLVFIDGDHSYTAVKGDFGRIAPWVAEEGIVCFHDCRCFEGVSRVVGEALASGKWALVGHVDNLLWIQPAKWFG